MTSSIHLRADMLMRHNRAKEAIQLLREHLATRPEDAESQRKLALALFLNHQWRESRQIAEAHLTNHPMSFEMINLLAEIDLAEEKYEDAQKKVLHLLTIYPEKANLHFLLGRVKAGQRYLDQALESIDRALAIEPDHIQALNFRALLSEQIGDIENAQTSLDEVLRIDPDNPTSMANHGLQLMRDGKIDEALQRFQEALSIQPGNALARHGMQEALKSRFWIYRMFFQYRKFMQKLSGKHVWYFIIGSYLVYRLILWMSQNTSGPLQIFLIVLVVLIALSFLLSWVIDPLMNLYLSTNKFGKVLLDSEDKTMATYTGLALICSVLFALVYAFIQSTNWLLACIFAAGMMIPAGTFLMPHKPHKQKKLKFFGITILLLGTAGLLLPVGTGNTLFTAAIFGLLGYQVYFNAIMINDFSRKF